MMIRTWGRVLSGKGDMSKNAKIQCIFRNENTILENFSNHGGIYKFERKFNTHSGEKKS